MADAIPVHGTEPKSEKPRTKPVPKPKAKNEDIPEKEVHEGAKPGTTRKLPSGAIRKDF